jgi:hypothetical protein
VADWVTAVVAAASGLAGATVTQGVTIWQARLQAGRDDRARSWEHRREVYVTFRQKMREMYDHMELVPYDREAEPIEHYYDHLYGVLADVEFFGSKEAHRVAEDVLDKSIGAFEARPKEPIRPEWLRSFVEQARRDLQVPD